MRKSMLALLFVSSATALAVIACNNGQDNAEKGSLSSDSTALVKRGAYLVNSIGCDDCHSPRRMGPKGPEIIPELRFSGYPSSRPVQNAETSVLKNGWVLFGPDLTSSVGPWGMSFSANITSDATGIGDWKEDQFINAIRHGKYKGLDTGRDLLPPMPWMTYKNMTDDDLKAIFAYLKSTNPVKNVVPAPIPLDQVK